jgi:hypothetical protein
MNDTGSWQDESLVVVHEALNEAEANIIKGILEDASIPVMLHSLQVSMYDGAMSMFHGHWGNVVVREEDYERALDVIQAAQMNE